jgi:hypothetical protein
VDKIKVIYDAVGHTLTVWIDDPNKEHICEETVDEVILMKDVNNRVIGFEVLHFTTDDDGRGVQVEAIVRRAS